MFSRCNFRFDSLGKPFLKSCFTFRRRLKNVRAGGRRIQKSKLEHNVNCTMLAFRASRNQQMYRCFGALPARHGTMCTTPREVRPLPGVRTAANSCVHWHRHKSSLPEEENGSDTTENRTRDLDGTSRKRYHCATPAAQKRQKNHTCSRYYLE